MITEFVHFFRPNIQGLFKAFQDFSLFQGLQEGQNQANIMPHQMHKERVRRFSSQTCEASLDKVGNKFSNTFQHRWQFSRTFKALNFYFEIQGLSPSRRLLTLCEKCLHYKF